MTNQKQKEFWSGQGGKNWVQKKETLDKMLNPFGNAALQNLNLSNISNVIDIGCGSGETTFQIAKSISTEGTVTGIDISEPLLEHANNHNSHTNVNFIMADVQSSKLEPNIYSHAFSRFGVMFFDDSVTAFKNIHQSLKPNGTLSFVCWQSAQKNLWQTLVMMEIKKIIDFPTPNLKDPGPFAFGDLDYVNNILLDAGFKNIEIDPFEKDVVIFNNYTADEAVVEMMTLNPALQFLKNYPKDDQKNIKTAVVSKFNEYKDGTGFKFPSAAWLAKASK